MFRKPKQRTGRWKRAEEQRFFKAIHKHGKNWAIIQKIVKTRTITQVRSHAQKFFSSFTPSERKHFEKQLSRIQQQFCRRNSIEKIQNVYQNQSQNLDSDKQTIKDCSEQSIDHINQKQNGSQHIKLEPKEENMKDDCCASMNSSTDMQGGYTPIQLLENIQGLSSCMWDPIMSIRCMAEYYMSCNFDLLQRIQKNSQLINSMKKIQ